ncbi:MAG: TonB-dependent receptor [Gammaproteobacteria bacterium]|nr:TonB-dependent receptor [Gammaproteobacteria bacterium]
MSPETGLIRDPAMQDGLDTCTGGAFPRKLQMKYSPFWAILALSAGIVAIPYSAYGDEQDEDPLTIVVTSSRAAETVDETMAPVTVIGREEIDRSGGKSVDDILSRVPGLVVISNGGRGSTSSIFLRGTSSTNVLVLVDGIKIGSATSGATSLEHIPLSIVEKIEVVRGPRSSLYGSEAIGGVIQIFTRQGGEALRPLLAISSGSHDTYDVEAGVSGSHDDVRYSLHAVTEETRGFNFRKNNNPDMDGYQNQSLNLKGGVNISDHVDLSSGLTLSDNETEYDGFSSTSDYESKALLRTFHVRGDWTVNDSIHGSLTLSESADKRDVFVNGSFSNRYNTRKQQVSWQNVLDWTKHRVVSGIDFIEDEVESTTKYDANQRDNVGYFALIRSNFNAVDVEASVRLDDNEQYGEKTTGSLAFGRDIHEVWRLTGSYGTAFQAPTFNQLYWPDAGDPDLSPEESSSVDIGIALRKANAEVSANVYRTEIENMIAGWPPSNIDKALITGLEVGFKASYRNMDVNGSLTLQEPLNNSGINRNKQLRRRAKQLAFLDVSQNFDPWEAGISLHYQGKSYDDAANKNRVDGFGRVDTRLTRLFKQHWNLELKINNLFDEDYETIQGYNQDGRNFLITLRYSPQ